MSQLDWTILITTILSIVFYGIWQTRKQTTSDEYLSGGHDARWLTVGLSVMATQASAITFLSTPGQAFHSGMGFVQFYFGLPIAMVIICITFIPIYHKLKVYTAYEYLESRFDLKTRVFTAFLFLIQRGLAAGITIYAPAIILSTILGWNLNNLIWIIGVLVIFYTVSGGTKAVNITQKQQMAVIMLGMFVAFFIIINSFPEDISFNDALTIAGQNEKMNILDFSWDLNNRYTIWTGLLGGTFLALSYFGTDQSQVQRYLSAESVKESRMGLIMNGLLKVPMQFFILLVGVMVFVFYQFNAAPVNFNPQSQVMYETEGGAAYAALQDEYDAIRQQKNDIYLGRAQGDIDHLSARAIEIEESAKLLISEHLPEVETNDKDYVFITWILDNMPKGLVGLLLAMILSAAMSSTASELNALGTTTSVDIYRRLFVPEASDRHYLWASKALTLLWGFIAIAFATYGTLFENLIQFVNIVGSVFYGTILGIFLVGFYIKKVKAQAIFLAAVISEALVIYIFMSDMVGYLWLNVIGCFLVIGISLFIQILRPGSPKPAQE